MSVLSPFQPSAERPWDRGAAGHLLRRAGFAPSEAEVRAVLRDGPQAAVARLVGAADESPRFEELDALGEPLAARNDIEALRGWWLLRMRHTQRPLHARMALFWHNHFATSHAKVGSAALMLQQLRTFERHGLGRFEQLVQAVSRDPAMIVWLDGQANVKGRPNENYARELLELFTLGVGNYSELDIREAARAFTGWQQRQGRFHFGRSDHDDGHKTVFGRSGRFDGDDVVRLAVEQPACAPFLAGKLLRELVCPEPPAELVDALAARLRETQFDLAATLTTLLSSEAMFEPRWRRTRIKSPVEFMLGVVRSLEMQMPAPALAEAVSQMGQPLFEPPSVKGWDDHRAWLNSATMLVRLNAVARATSQKSFRPAELRERYELRTLDDVLAFCRNLTLDGDVPQAVQQQLDEIDGGSDDVLRRALRVLLATPEYQMA